VEAKDDDDDEEEDDEEEAEERPSRRSTPTGALTKAHASMKKPMWRASSPLMDTFESERMMPTKKKHNQMDKGRGNRYVQT
jgi:hypothetical protein